MIQNKTYVFTGFRDRVIEEFITKQGGFVKDSITILTNVLIIKDENHRTTVKANKAVKLNIKIQTLDEFKKSLTKKEKQNLTQVYDNTVDKSIKGIVYKQTEGNDIYFVKHNGAYPYKVVINPIKNTYQVFKCNYEETYKAKYGVIPENYNTLVRKGKFIKLFVDNATSLLLQITKTKYLFIGHHMYVFEPGEDILKFTSVISHNDSVYPYATGKEKSYLLIEHVAIPRILIKDTPNLDPYEYYYFGNDSRLTYEERKKRMKDLEQKYKYNMIEAFTYVY